MSECVLVAVPVKDEAERIADCLRALTLQADRQPDGVVLLINNTTDGTAAVAWSILPALPAPVEVLEVEFPPETACAGSARRAAMEHAATRLGAEGVLMTTDADGRVPPDWVAANLWHLRQGADAVAGRAVLDPGDAALLPPRLHEDDALECAYAELLDTIAALIDPEPWDPLPRHTEHSGASIAVTRAAYRRAGGMPAMPLAEDRHFFEALRGPAAASGTRRRSRSWSRAARSVGRRAAWRTRSGAVWPRPTHIWTARSSPRRCARAGSGCGARFGRATMTMAPSRGSRPSWACPGSRFEPPARRDAGLRAGPRLRRPVPS